jgi:putative ABC transport system permease protein
MTGSIGYTTALTEYAIKQMVQSEIVQEQLANPEMDILHGRPFKDVAEKLSDSEKINFIKAYFSAFSVSRKAEAYINLKAQMPADQLEATVNSMLAFYTEDQLKEMVVQAYAAQMGVAPEQVRAYIDTMSKEDLMNAIRESLAEQVKAQYEAGIRMQFASKSEEELAALFDADVLSDEQYLEFFEIYLPETHSNSSYEDNLSMLGYVDIDSPTAINIYASTFANKDEISALIAEYNRNVENEDDEINYTDFVALLMSSITLVINAISYVLIAFVSVSLVVSSIMIGIITYISVLERTKEIGILRAIGASKKDVSGMFNAETVIIGFTSGLLGVVVTYLLTFPINFIINTLTGISNLDAIFPLPVALILIGISVVLTLIAGIIPSASAAKKDPVVALRTE